MQFSWVFFGFGSACLLLSYLTLLLVKLHKLTSFGWSNELCPGEVGDLRICNLYSKDACGPVVPALMEAESDIPPFKYNSQPNPCEFAGID